MRCISGIVDFAVAVGPIGSIIIIIMSTGMITMSVWRSVGSMRGVQSIGVVSITQYISISKKQV